VIDHGSSSSRIEQENDDTNSQENADRSRPFQVLVLLGLSIDRLISQRSVLAFGSLWTVNVIAGCHRSRRATVVDDAAKVNGRQARGFVGPKSCREERI
jgi:hypothetical protein